MVPYSLHVALPAQPNLQLHPGQQPARAIYLLDGPTSPSLHDPVSGQECQSIGSQPSDSIGIYQIHHMERIRIIYLTR